jgi:DNA-binding response OmpR family regulator
MSSSAGHLQEAQVLMDAADRQLLGAARPCAEFEERVLLVEDDPGFLRLLELRLDQEGATTFSVSSGDDALAALETFAPTLVIADLMMPGMDGLSLCRRIRSDPRHRRLPILILTSADHSSEVGEVVGLGLIWYMRKGAEWTTVMRSLRNLAAHREDLQPV